MSGVPVRSLGTGEVWRRWTGIESRRNERSARPVAWDGGLAEVDGNRTRRTGSARPTRFEGGGAHQVPGHLQWSVRLVVRWDTVYWHEEAFPHCGAARPHVLRRPQASGRLKGPLSGL